MCKPEIEFNAIECTNQTRSIDNRCICTTRSPKFLRSIGNNSFTNISKISNQISHNDFNNLNNNFKHPSIHHDLVPNSKLISTDSFDQRSFERFSNQSNVYSTFNEQICSKMNNSTVNNLSLDLFVRSKSSENIMKRNKPQLNQNHLNQLNLCNRLNNQIICSSKKPVDNKLINYSHALSSYLLNSSYLSKSFLTVKSSSATKPFNRKPNSPIKFRNKIFNLSFSSSLLILLFCLIQIIINVNAASTAFDYQNNQPDNSIVYQGILNGTRFFSLISIIKISS